MSGLKTTRYVISQERLRQIREAQQKNERIQQEKAMRARLTADLTQQKQRVATITTNLEELLRTTPQGLKETFRNSVSDTERWATNVQKIIRDLDVNGQNLTLKHQLDKLNSLREEGQKHLKILTKNFTKDADNMEKSMIDEMIDLNGKFEENKELLSKWTGLDFVNKVSKDFAGMGRCIKDKKLKDAANLKNQISSNLANQIESVNKFSLIFNQYEDEKDLVRSWFEEEIQTIDKKFETAKNHLKEAKYVDLNRDLTEIKKNIGAKITEAKELDEKDQKRKYVLDSLKKVCNSMGFEEVGTSSEGKGKSNRVIYTIDTFSQGKIKFCLSLDSIEADSGIVDNHCLSEFDKVSESLQKNFGVQTKFKRVSESNPPGDITRTSKDPPKDDDPQSTTSST
jgi:hypothetical protein